MEFVDKPNTPSEPSPPNRNSDVCVHAIADPLLAGGLTSSLGVICCQCKF